MVINHFEIDDIAHRLVVVFYLVCLFGFTTVSKGICLPVQKSHVSLPEHCLRIRIDLHVTNRLLHHQSYVWGYLVSTRGHSVT